MNMSLYHYGQNSSAGNNDDDDDDGITPADATEETAPLFPVAATAETAAPEEEGMHSNENFDNAEDGIHEDEDEHLDDVDIDMSVEEGYPSMEHQPDEEIGAPVKKSPPSELSKPSLASLRVGETSLILKSDVPLAAQATHPRGILHATRGVVVSGHHQSGEAREDHAFAWIEGNADDPSGAVSQAAVGFFVAAQFRASQMRFIPFSSRANWVARYPHAVPCVSCDETGAIVDCLPPPLVPLAAGDDVGLSPPKVKKARGKKKAAPCLLARGRLPDLEREKLHIEIYKYLSWLHDELAEMETSSAGQRRVLGSGMQVHGLQSIVAKLEKTFRVVQAENKQREGQVKEGAQAKEFRDSCQPPQQNLIADVPFLETALEVELQDMVVDRKTSNSGNNEGGYSATDGHDVHPDEGKGKKISWRKVSFETMYQKLVQFRVSLITTRCNTIKHSTNCNQP